MIKIMHKMINMTGKLDAIIRSMPFGTSSVSTLGKSSWILTRCRELPRREVNEYDDVTHKLLEQLFGPIDDSSAKKEHQGRQITLISLLWPNMWMSQKKSTLLHMFVRLHDLLLLLVWVLGLNFPF